MPLLYSDVTKPHLWPAADLQEARKELRARLSSHQATPAGRALAAAQLVEIEYQLELKKRKPR